MFNRDTESLLKSRHSDVARMRRRNETISKHHLSIIRRRFEYDIYRNTDITIDSEIASFMKRLLSGDLAESSRSKFFYKEVKIYFSIKALTKFVCQTKHYSIHSFTDFLIVSLRVENSDSRYKRSNITEKVLTPNVRANEEETIALRRCNRFFIAQRLFPIVHKDSIVTTRMGPILGATTENELSINQSISIRKKTYFSQYQ